MKKILILFVLLFIQTASAFTVPGCDLVTTNGNITVGGNQSDVNRTTTNCINGTYYNFTVNSTETVTNISFTADSSGIVYQLRNQSSGFVLNTTTYNYFNENLNANSTYQIYKMTSGWNELYIVSGVGTAVIIAYGLWNRKRS